MRRHPLAAALAATLVASCASAPDTGTLAELRSVEPDVAEVEVADSLDLAMQSYRRYLDETPTSAMTPEAMRRLADLQLEKEFGITGGAAPSGRWTEMAAPDAGEAPSRIGAGAAPTIADAIAAADESDEDFERRTTGELEFQPVAAFDVPVAGAGTASGPLEAIAIYERLLAEYPNYERRDQVLYQMARAYDELGRTEEAMAVMQRLVGEFGYSRYSDEVQFRRGEYYFTRRKFREAEQAYETIASAGPRSDFYELALYKLGWSLYKQDFYEEALHRYNALLDYKLSVGYDFDAAHEEEDERRVTDTFRVISLSFSNLGGPDVLAEYYSSYGNRSYEDRIYKNLAEFYFDKHALQRRGRRLRLVRRALPVPPRVARVQHARDRNLRGRRFPEARRRVEEVVRDEVRPPERVLAALRFRPSGPRCSAISRRTCTTSRTTTTRSIKSRLSRTRSRRTMPRRSSGIARSSTSFPQDEQSPGINYQLADLLLENGDFGEAAREYERTAYEYAPHERASAAGYAAIVAHRDQLKNAGEDEQPVLKRATVDSSLKFADTFPEHEHAPVVLGAAAEDLYALEDFGGAVAAGRTLIERYPAADVALRRTAWTVVAHSSFELADYQAAEPAYSEVLALTPPEDEARQALVDNLAASIYKQAEQANEAQDYRAAAGHFLRITERAPTSSIRPAAEYDAAAALMKLQDWTAAATVLDGVPRGVPRARAQRRGDEAARVRLSRGRRNLARGRGVRARGRRSRGSGARARGAALGRRALRAGERRRQRARRLRTLRRGVRAARRRRHGDALEGRRDVPRARRRGALPRAPCRARRGRCRRGRRADGSHSLSRRAGRARPRAAALRGVQRRAARAAVRAEPRAQARAHGRGARRRSRASSTYEVGEVTTAATFHMAEIYSSFSRSLLDSERPDGPLRGRARGVRGRARGRGVPVRRARDRGPRSERRAS